LPYGSGPESKQQIPLGPMPIALFFFFPSETPRFTSSVVANALEMKLIGAKNQYIQSVLTNILGVFGNALFGINHD
jgi:hypothetical protein